jgi:hypothetical protein
MDNSRGNEPEFGWSAHPPAGYSREPADDVPAPVDGTRIRFMCDYGVTMPLWDRAGPLPDDPAYLERELGISRELVAELSAWAADWDLDTTDPTQTQAWWDRRPQHGAEAHRLFGRLQAEIAPRFSVVSKH